MTTPCMFRASGVGGERRHMCNSGSASEKAAGLGGAERQREEAVSCWVRRAGIAIRLTWHRLIGLLPLHCAHIIVISRNAFYVE